MALALPVACTSSDDMAQTQVEALLAATSPTIDDLAQASVVATTLVLHHAPKAIEQRLFDAPEGIPALYATLSRVLNDGTPEHRAQTATFLDDVARARAGRLARRGTWAPGDIGLLLAMLTVDPRRFEADPRFRDARLDRMTTTLAADAPDDDTRQLRDDLLSALASRRVVTFAAHERVALGWGRVERLSAHRRGEVAHAAPPTARLPSPLAPLDASVYVLPSTVINANEAVSFLRGVRGIAPERRLIVLADGVQRTHLAPHAGPLGLTVLPTFDRGFSPWPRDPLTVLEDGRVVIAVRPNTQRGREADAMLGQALIQTLPTDLDQRWGTVRWRPSPVPFHNGQMLDTGDAVWVSLHSLEPRVLALRGLDRVPVSAFGTEEGRRYVDAARQAADELATLYGRPVRFVHALPDTHAPYDEATAQHRVATLHALGGGAGFDLDSLVTLLPIPERGPDQTLIAFVGEIEHGRRLLESASVAELDALSNAYALNARGDNLRQALARAARRSRATALDTFLDQIAYHLTSEGVRVMRLPLYLVPRSLRLAPEVDTDPDFLIGWHNVVLERRDDQRRAEGFVAHFAPGDRVARDRYREAGYHLDLVPSLIASVVRNGGYRCASQHIRRSPSD